MDVPGNIQVTDNKLPYKGMGWIIHIAAWGILFCMPLIFSGRNDETITLENYLRFIIGPLSFMVVFYVNYLWLIKKYLFTKHTWQFILINIIVIAVAIIGVHLLMQLFPPPLDRPRPERAWQETIGFFIGHAILYMLVVGLSVAIKMTGNWYQTETERIELERSKSEAELQNLKSQLNPHFLFNTLNNIYSLIAFSPEKAQEAVHDLSRLLRYVLYDSSQSEVSLSKELDFIKNYVELMKIRLPEHVDVKMDISSNLNPDATIAPLLFISLIENAFKHGISPAKQSFVHVHISRQGDQIMCAIENSYFPKDAQQDKSGSGIGLANLHKRLALLYPNRHILSYGLENENYVSTLIIQNEINMRDS